MLIALKKKNTKLFISKWTVELNTQFIKETQMPNEYFKSVQRPLAIWKNEIPISLQSDIIRKASHWDGAQWLGCINEALDSVSAGAECWKESGCSLIPGAAPHSWSCCGSQYAGSSNKQTNRKLELPFDLAVYPREIQATFVVIAVLFTMANKWKQPGWPSTDENVRCTVELYTGINHVWHLQENGGSWTSS